MSGTFLMGSGNVLAPGDLIIVGTHPRDDGTTVYGVVIELIEQISPMPGAHNMCTALVRDRVVLLFSNEFVPAERANVKIKV